MRFLPTLPAPARRALFAVALLACLAPAAARADVSVGIFPALVNNVTPGAQFDVELDVTQAGSEFNGFDAIVRFDPAALTFVPVSNSFRVGCLMNGTCSAACGTTTQFMNTGITDSVDVNLALLCNQIFLTGPGQILKLRFQASNTPQITTLHLSNRTKFARDGVYILYPAVTTSDATVAIGMTLGVDGASAPMALRVTATPNPANGPVSLAITAPTAGLQQVEVLDLSGRRVRTLTGGWFPRGSRALTWDGTDEAGAPLPAGVYLVRTRAGAATTATRVTILH